MTIMQDLPAEAFFRFPGGVSIFQVVEPDATFRTVATGHVHFQSSQPEQVIETPWFAKVGQ
jgi:hypothetical protein